MTAEDEDEDGLSIEVAMVLSERVVMTESALLLSDNGDSGGGSLEGGLLASPLAGMAG